MSASEGGIHGFSNTRLSDVSSIATDLAITALSAHVDTLGAMVKEINYRVDVDTLHREPTETLGLNDIARVRITTAPRLAASRRGRARS